jgi:hypothetical protein
MSASDQVAPTERHKFLHDGRVIYEWNQTLHELNLFVQGPPGVRAKQVEVTITSSHLSIGIVGSPPYMSVSAGLRASCGNPCMSRIARRGQPGPDACPCSCDAA